MLPRSAHQGSHPGHADHRQAAEELILPRVSAAAERAVIDIGSNTVRLVIVGGPPRAPITLFNEKVTARLGRGLAETGALAPKAMAQALAALARFAALIVARGIRRVETVATAAARDAQNGPEFLAQVAALGLSPRLLSGEEEAAASALGVIAAFPDARGTVADLGGGSLELVHVADGASARGISLPLGSLRLAALREKGQARFARRVAGMIAQSGWPVGGGETLYLVGGSYRSLARYAMEREQWPLDDPHGHVLSPDATLAHCRMARRGKLPAGISGVSASRLASLPDSAALLEALVEVLAPERIVISSWGLREGLLHAGLTPALRLEDPLLAGIGAFAAQQGAQAETARAMAAWVRPALAACERIAPGDERLLEAAALLALAAQSIEPNLRAREMLGWALAKRWIGIDAAGRAMIAAALVGNQGDRALPAPLDRLAPPRRLGDALAWGLALRLCRRLAGGVVPAKGQASLGIGGGRLTLSISPHWRALSGEVVEKDLRLLAAQLALNSAIAP